MKYIAFALFVIYIQLINATTINANEFRNVDFTYVEYKNVRDSSYDFLNLRTTYKFCEIYNDDEHSLNACLKFAYERAITIDA